MPIVQFLGIIDIIAAVLIGIGDFPKLGYAKFFIVAILLIKGVPSVISK